MNSMHSFIGVLVAPIISLNNGLFGGFRLSTTNDKHVSSPPKNKRELSTHQYHEYSMQPSLTS